MPPLQPRYDRPANRDNGAAAQADDDAHQMVGSDLRPHYDALKHIASCYDCRCRLFARFLEATLPDSELGQFAVPPL